MQQKNQNKELENFIDDLLDDVEDPIVFETGAFGYMGFIESLILNSLNTCEEQSRLINSLETMRKSEMDKLCAELKEIQNHRDCREQFREMCKRGVFN